MEAKLRQVQPAVVEALMRQDHASPVSPLVPSPVKPEANQSAKPFGPGKKSQDQFIDKGDPGRTRRLVEEVQSYLDSYGIQLSFNIHYETRDTVVQVIDRETGEVIRQIPSDELLDLRERVDELRGMLLDQKG